MRKYTKIIKNAKEYLESLDKRFETLVDESEEFYYVMREFYDFYNELNNIRIKHIEDFKIPNDLEALINKINSQFKMKIFKQDADMWLEHITDSVHRLLYVYNTVPSGLNGKEKKIIQESVERHYGNIIENIEYYNKIFQKDVPDQLKSEMEVCVKKFVTIYGIYIKTSQDVNLGVVNIDSIDYDETLKLHEQIKEMKDGEEKDQLKKKLDNWIHILKEDTNGR
jgi:hypothetical protein